MPVGRTFSDMNKRGMNGFSKIFCFRTTKMIYAKSLKCVEKHMDCSIEATSAAECELEVRQASLMYILADPHFSRSLVFGHYLQNSSPVTLQKSNYGCGVRINTHTRKPQAEK